MWAFQYSIHLILQIVFLYILMLLFYKKRYSINHSINLFQPINWFVLFYIFSFLITQFILPFYDFNIIGMEYFSVDDRIEAMISAQNVLSLFLFCVLIGGVIQKSVFQPKHLKIYTELKKIKSFSYIFSGLFILVGFLGWVYLSLSLGSGPRSQLVKTFSGQIAYALTFFMSTGMIILTIKSLKNKKYMISFILIVAYSFLFIQLGGRGRVLWPILQIVLFFLILNNKKISFFKMSLLFSVLYLALGILDPIYLKLKGEQINILSELNEINVFDLFMKRTFDSFHNIAVIISQDIIPITPSVLLGGSGELFMMTYFPEVYANGVGFPVSFVGELWIASRWIGVIIGGIMFGFFLGVINKFYWSINSELKLIFYLLLIQWFAFIGLAYLDQVTKVISSLLPLLMLITFEKVSIKEGTVKHEKKDVYNI